MSDIIKIFKFMNYLIWVKSLFISCMIVWFSIYALEALDKSKPKKIHVNALTLEEVKKELGHEYGVLIMDCDYDGEDWKVKCDEIILNSYNDKKIIKEDISVNKNRNNGGFLIYTIYLLLSLCLSSQLTIYFNRFKFDDLHELERVHYISDWAINSAPILGVLGTVVSFALLVGSSQFNDIQEVFKSSFFDAAITTILGGFIYVFNLCLNIFIQPIIQLKISEIKGR